MRKELIVPVIKWELVGERFFSTSKAGLFVIEKHGALYYWHEPPHEADTLFHGTLASRNGGSLEKCKTEVAAVCRCRLEFSVMNKRYS